MQPCGDSLGPIASSRCIQRRQILTDLRDIRSEAKVLVHPCVVLRRMVAVRYEPNAQVLLLLQLARVEDMRADFLDVARC